MLNTSHKIIEKEKGENNFVYCEEGLVNPSVTENYYFPTFVKK